VTVVVTVQIIRKGHSVALEQTRATVAADELDVIDMVEFCARAAAVKAWKPVAGKLN
jgi:hypothetical protein